LPGRTEGVSEFVWDTREAKGVRARA
jgi:hypothetical protein